MIIFTFSQHIRGKMPSYEGDNKTHFDQTDDNGTYFATNASTSFTVSLNENSTESQNNSVPDESVYWPAWVEAITCVSHLLLAFNCSVNFFIYYFKHRSYVKRSKFNNDFGNCKFL